MTILTVCRCGTITPRKPCPTCAQTDNHRRNNKPKRVQWRKAAAQKKRRQVLHRDNHTCQLQYPDICQGRATTVDHGDTDDPSQWKAACLPCHGRKDGAQAHAQS